MLGLGFELGLVFLLDKLLNFRFYGSHQMCGCGCSSSETTSVSGVRNQPIVVFEINCWD